MQKLFDFMCFAALLYSLYTIGLKYVKIKTLYNTESSVSGVLVQTEEHNLTFF